MVKKGHNESRYVKGHDCIAAVVLKNCESKLLYILAQLFNKCLKESGFYIVGGFHWWSLYLRLLWKGLQLKIAQDCK